MRTVHFAFIALCSWLIYAAISLAVQAAGSPIYQFAEVGAGTYFLIVALVSAATYLTFARQPSVTSKSGRMARWPFDADPSEDYRTAALLAFREGRRTVDNSSARTTHAFATALAINWKMFLHDHGSLAKFKLLSHDEKLKSYQQCLAMIRYRPDDPEAVFAAKIFCQYVAAVMIEDSDFEAETAQFITPHIAHGWHFIDIPELPSTAV